MRIRFEARGLKSVSNGWHTASWAARAGTSHLSPEIWCRAFGAQPRSIAIPAWRPGLFTAGPSGLDTPWFNRRTASSGLATPWFNRRTAS